MDLYPGDVKGATLGGSPALQTCPAWGAVIGQKDGIICRLRDVVLINPLT